MALCHPAARSSWKPERRRNPPGARPPASLLKEDSWVVAGSHTPRDARGCCENQGHPRPFLLPRVQGQPRQKTPSATQSRTPEGQTEGETVLRKNDRSRRVKTVKRCLSQGCRTCCDRGSKNTAALSSARCPTPLFAQDSSGVSAEGPSHWVRSRPG